MKVLAGVAVRASTSTCLSARSLWGVAGGGAVLDEGLDAGAAGSPRTELSVRGWSPTADGAPGAVQPGRHAVVSDVAPLCQLRVEVVRERLQGCDVDLASVEAPALVVLVEIVAELAGPAGDRGDESLEAGLVAVVLLLLPSVGRARARPTNSSDRTRDGS